MQKPKPLTRQHFGFQPAKSKEEEALQDYCIAVLMGLEKELMRDGSTIEIAVMKINNHIEYVSSQQLLAFQNGASVHDCVRWIAQNIQTSAPAERRIKPI